MTEDQTFKEMVDEIEQFVIRYGSGVRFPRSKWFGCMLMEVYFRVNPVMKFKQGMKRVLVVSNVTVYDEFRGQGVYSAFLSLVEDIGKKHNFDGIVIENVLDSKQQTIYTSRGYQMIDSTKETKSPWFLKKL